MTYKPSFVSGLSLFNQRSSRQGDHDQYDLPRHLKGITMRASSKSISRTSSNGSLRLIAILWIATHTMIVQTFPDQHEVEGPAPQNYSSKYFVLSLRIFLNFVFWVQLTSTKKLPYFLYSNLRKFLNIWEWLKPYLSNLLKIQDGVKNDKKET